MYLIAAGSAVRGASAVLASPQVERLAWARGDAILCSFIKNWYEYFFIWKYLREKIDLGR
jgi:hypothetical protein